MIRRLIILLLIVGCGTEPEDCAGVAGGNSYLDECGGCDANVNNDCTQDDCGVWGGGSAVDDAGFCGCGNLNCVISETYTLTKIIEHPEGDCSTNNGVTGECDVNEGCQGFDYLGNCESYVILDSPLLSEADCESAGYDWRPYEHNVENNMDFTFFDDGTGTFDLTVEGLYDAPFIWTLDGNALTTIWVVDPPEDGFSFTVFENTIILNLIVSGTCIEYIYTSLPN